MEKENGLVKINNNVLKKTDNIFSITNKVLSKKQLILYDDYEWWDSLDDIWKKIFNLYINKPNHNFQLTTGEIYSRYDDCTYELGSAWDKNELKKFILFKGSVSKPNKLELNKILELTNININDFDYLDPSESPSLNIKDLSPLKRLKNLKCLIVHNSHKNVDIEYIKSCVNLEILQVNCIENNERVLQNFKKLKILNLSWSELLNIESIKNLNNLEFLSLGFTPVANLTPLKDLNKLKFIGLCSSSKNYDLTPLIGLKSLKYLYLHDFFTYKKYRDFYKKHLNHCTIIP
ncbi:hypothetical protein [Polaribacter sp. IC073]|uniref:hypothetical protein n=1 Tax=Polaribacter sp. IC073 TaxID=2508540 RepID=UPI0011BDEDA8|nr:hypothetical protein [Polaribacter sp. IC073]TXD49197.1 hypothetical protein ES045_03785 [Polaribacter sp. IC073]